MIALKERFETMYAAIERFDKEKASKMYVAYTEFMNRLGDGLAGFITMSK